MCLKNDYFLTAKVANSIEITLLHVALTLGTYSNVAGYKDSPNSFLLILIGTHLIISGLELVAIIKKHFTTFAISLGARVLLFVNIISIYAIIMILEFRQYLI